MKSRSLIKCLGAGLFGLLLVLPAVAQREGRAGGGYGRVFEATGGSPAAQSLKNKLGNALKIALSRPATTARTPVRRTARPAATPASRTGRTTTPVEPQPVESYTSFRPNPANDSMATLANALGTTPEEKLLYKQVFTATKTAFENEVAKKGRKNNISAALTFFIGSTVWVYHNSAEPSDAALDSLWDGLEGALENTPEMAQLSDNDKQLFYDMLIAFSGVVLATYDQAKKSNNGDLLLTSQVLAGTLIQTVLKSDPEKLRFTATGLVADS
jgi:hypothetical protein